ncbi:Hypothetical predicted protein, partial [Mytilus galloprovincialis]
MANAISPNTDKICGFTDRWTVEFCKDNDNIKVKPSRNQSVPLSVHVIFTLFGISGVDEIEQKLSATGWLEIEWTDELLSWKSASYEGLKYINYPQGEVWKPDISLQNGFTKLEELGLKIILVFIDSNGLIPVGTAERIAIESGCAHLSDDEPVYLLRTLTRKCRKRSVQSESKMPLWLDKDENCVTWMEAISALDKVLFW